MREPLLKQSICDVFLSRPPARALAEERTSSNDSASAGEIELHRRMVALIVFLQLGRLAYRAASGSRNQFRLWPNRRRAQATLGQKFAPGDSHLAPPSVIATWDEGKGHSKFPGQLWHQQSRGLRADADCLLCRLLPFGRTSQSPAPDSQA